MTTQSLRGMANHGSMHWRGDRTGGNDPGGSPFDEDAAFKKFNVAFPGLVGRESQLDADEMQAFTNFILTETYPPNPVRNLDNSFTANQQLGHDLFFGRITDTVFNCNGCHTLDRSLGLFGSSAFSTFEGETQMFKVPHLRNAYTKIGMFGRSSQGAQQGNQIRGFGFLHDGSIDTVGRFLNAGVFTLTNPERNQLEQFVLAFDSNLFPIVGQQITLNATNGAVAGPRADLLIARAALGECDVVIKGTIAGTPRGGVREADGSIQMDRSAEVLSEPAVRAFAAVPGHELTYTCVPPGSGRRIGIDRDEDGFLDGDEVDAGSDPANALDRPTTPIRASALKLADDAKPPIDPTHRKLSFRSSRFQGIPSGVVVPAWDSAGDPTSPGSTGGAFIVLSSVNNPGQTLVIPLPQSHWTRTGSATNQGSKYRHRALVDGPIKTVTVKDGKLSISGKGAALFSLADAPQGTVALRMYLGTAPAPGFCAAAPAKVPATSNDTPAKFTGAPNTPPPAPCPPLS